MPRTRPIRSDKQLNARRHAGDRPADQRSDGQRDRDRILYSSAFRRLAGITQVVSPAEGYVFHNRLTHTLKVAQIARRLAELAQNRQSSVVATLGGIDPDVVEAAALAHDLGHPPFGHIAEKELNALATKAGAKDGFEGNAQSFRILTKLSVRAPIPGLNLTRATLDATLKYPWFRGARGKKSRKWGAYTSEEEDFRWARRGNREDRRSPEAELMDWADDIAYSVYDVEDFYRAGLLPIDRLAYMEKERETFLNTTFARWKSEGRMDRPQSEYEESFEGLIATCRAYPISRPYRGTHEQRIGIRSFTSLLVARYIVDGLHLRVPRGDDTFVELEPDYVSELALLRELIWHYIILDPSLSTQQHGQRRIIRTLFEVFHDAAVGRSRQPWMLPELNREDLEEAGTKAEAVRVVVDYIAGMTEEHARQLYSRVTGISPGSVRESFRD